LSGLTKDIKFRKQQLSNLARFCLENADALLDAVYKDLRKHRIEADIGEISPVVDECEYMIKHLDQWVKPTHTSKRSLFSTSTKTYIRKDPKGVALVIGKEELCFNI
jgi:acyl-CoA reductase-like NAD-dependent aldehyde dehydrogenase